MHVPSSPRKRRIIEHSDNKTVWLAYGSGQRRAEFLRAALKCKPGRSTVANAGIKDIANPTWFCCTDPKAVRLYGSLGVLSKEMYKTKLWGRKKDWPIVADIPYDLKNRDKYHRNRIAHGRSIGIIQLQLALMHGARTVLMVGYDGYSDQYGKYRPGWTDKMNESMGLVLKQVFHDRRDCKFVWFGGDVLRRYVGALPKHVKVVH